MNIAPRYILITIHIITLQAKKPYYYGRQLYTRAQIIRHEKCNRKKRRSLEDEWMGISPPLRRAPSNFEAYALINGSQTTNRSTGTRDCALCNNAHACIRTYGYIHTRLPACTYTKDTRTCNVVSTW